MSNGFVLKVLENVEQLVNEGADVGPLIDAAKEQVQHGHDANPHEWDMLNEALGDADTQKARAQRVTGDYPGAQGQTIGASRGVGGSERYVSGAEPGTLGNPIGYPGTDQDRDGPPGTTPQTVPGVKPPKDPSKP